MNRQVPESNNIESIAIIGNGKVANHMRHYFAAVGQPFTHWFRANNTSSQEKPQSRLSRYKLKLQNLFKPSSSLESVVSNSQTVLLLIPDDQIEPFILKNPILKNKKLVHFSGSLNSQYAIGCHPLMTFGEQLYSFDKYLKTPFVVDEGVDFNSIFPLFENPVHEINTKDKALYHAYCVMAGNFSQMLWRNIQQGLEQINLPAELMSAYLQQNTENFINDSEQSMTGPMIRGDVSTIEKHQEALLGHPLQKIYQSFYELNKQEDASVKRNQL